ncbi:MAG: 7-carboxy-7-deazaguanine synthase [Proteobacteria bacterium]|nr:7-carboxy-7-deazaguanine synthase [Pseudomonadota bacterium]
MAYTVKEIFLTLQGEGAQAGRVAVFCRFSGCNLWTGREEDRAKAVCQFCDTDFVGGDRFKDAVQLADRIAATWGPDRDRRFVVFTGGEPLLQLDAALIDACHALGFEIAVETNGTIAAPDGIDWICVSPKAGAPLVQKTGHELKLVFPQPALLPEAFADFGERFQRYALQPMDGPNVRANTEAAIAFCLAHPRWQLSLQTHKITGIR